MEKKEKDLQKRVAAANAELEKICKKFNVVLRLSLVYGTQGIIPKLDWQELKK